MARLRRYFFLVLTLVLLLAAGAGSLSFAIPSKNGATHEITFDTLDAGGLSAGGYAGTANDAIISIGQPGGNLKLGGVSTVVQTGYFGQDLLAPRAITSLSTFVNTSAGKILFSWAAPGDDIDTEMLLPGSRIVIATTTIAAEAQNEGYWNTKRNQGASEIVISTSGISPGQTLSYELTGLPEGVTYYFRIWTLDQAANWSDISNGTTQYYVLPPRAVGDLGAIPGRYGRTIILNWSAPVLYGGKINTGQYAIQRSTWETVAFSTSTSDVVFVSTSNVATGSRQEVALAGLQQGVTYYMALWTAANVPGWSDISNTTSTWANVVRLSITLPTTFYNYGVLPTAVSTNSATAITVVNSGNVLQNYSLSASNSSSWAIADSPAIDTFSLQAAFHSTRPIPATTFGAGNIVKTSSVESSAAMYTIDGTQTGINVDPFIASSRSLWLRLWTPTMTSTPARQDINVTITAEESLETP